jgi:DNA replication protein DnaC
MVIERALTLDFLPEARNLVLVGTNGLGKTMIAQNICHAAVLAGHSVLFRSAASLLEELHRQSPEGRQRKLRTYANVGLLGVDEVGYLSFDDKSADLLLSLQIMGADIQRLRLGMAAEIQRRKGRRAMVSTQ